MSEGPADADGDGDDARSGSDGDATEVDASGGSGVDGSADSAGVDDRNGAVGTGGSADSDGDADAAPPADVDSAGPASGRGSTTGDDWRGTLAEVGSLTPEAVSAIADAHGDRGLQAIEAVSEGRVKQYRDFTVVVGHTDEYVVEDGGCTCKDSAYNLDRENPDARCWHALAVDVAAALGEVDHHDMWYSEVREFL